MRMAKHATVLQNLSRLQARSLVGVPSAIMAAIPSPTDPTKEQPQLSRSFSTATTSDYRALFLHSTPMMDVRAPIEFTHGALPSARSLPLMSDDERAQVGTCFKQHGQAAAVTLGHALVQGDSKAHRVVGWKAFALQHPRGVLYCARGGLRSHTVQQWLREETGLEYPLVAGGYKAMRRFLLEELERSVASASFVLISGKTGTGKTRAIKELAAHSVDLEGLANHRGSSFGQMPTPQPSQADFENEMSIAMLRLLATTPETKSSHRTRMLFLEDEGRLIGKMSVPMSLRAKMATAPMAVVEVCFYLPLHFKRILLTILTCPPHIILTFKNRGQGTPE